MAKEEKRYGVEDFAKEVDTSPSNARAWMRNNDVRKKDGEPYSFTKKQLDELVKEYETSRRKSEGKPKAKAKTAKPKAKAKAAKTKTKPAVKRKPRAESEDRPAA